MGCVNPVFRCINFSEEAIAKKRGSLHTNQTLKGVEAVSQGRCGGITVER